VSDINWQTFLQLLPSTATVICAGVIACMGKDGWGWFLLAAFLMWTIMPVLNHPKKEKSYEEIDSRPV